MKKINDTVIRKIDGFDSFLGFFNLIFEFNYCRTADNIIKRTIRNQNIKGLKYFVILETGWLKREGVNCLMLHSSTAVSNH